MTSEFEKVDGSTVTTAFTMTRRLGRLQRWARRLVNTSRFLVVLSVMIMASCATLGVEVNETMINPDEERHEVFRIVDYCFIVFFMLELAIRWISGGWFFMSPKNYDFRWNVFDLLIVVISIFEEILWTLSVDIVKLDCIRLARLLRLTLMLRAFKIIRELKELRIMVGGLVNCVKPLFWAAVLIASLTYMSALLIGQILHLKRQQESGYGTKELEAFVEDNFPNLPFAMYTLLEALLGGNDWGALAHPFMDISGSLLCVLLLYIGLGVFCLLNLVTAVFLEAATRVDDAREIVYQKRDWMTTVHGFFTKSIYMLEEKLQERHGAERGVLTKDRFVTVMHKKETTKFLEENGVDLCFEHKSRYEELFDLMDEDKNGAIDVNEFIASLYHLKGAARALDVQLEHRRTFKKLGELLEAIGRLPQMRHTSRELSADGASSL